MADLPVRLSDCEKPIPALISPAQRAFLEDLWHDLRGRPFWGTLEVKVQNGEPVGSKVLQETRAYGG